MVGGLGMTGSQGDGGLGVVIGAWGGLGGGGVLACILLKLHKLHQVVSKNLIVYQMEQVVLPMEW